MVNFRKRHLFLALVFLFGSFFIVFPVRAQELSKRFTCLQSARCDSKDAGCSGKGVRVHRASLKTKPSAKQIPDSETYILECISSSKGPVCTTGNRQLDNKLSIGNMPSRYIFDGLFLMDGKTKAGNPVMSDKGGEIPQLEWASHIQPSAKRKFLALNLFTPTPTVNPMGAGGLQQGTFDFENTFNASDCVAINWDPYGRVFDADSLEPVSNAVVKLLIKRNSGTFSLFNNSDAIGVTNPIVTKEDGSFSFVVPDGTYRMLVGANNYSFPALEKEINPNYSKAYSDIYPTLTGEDIIQKGTIQHRDIPIKSQSVSVSRKVKLMDYFYSLDKGRGILLISGRVSHPLSRIMVYTIKIGDGSKLRLLFSNQVDKNGQFDIKINTAGFKDGETFGKLEIEKVDLAATPLSLKINKKSKFLSMLERLVNKIVNYVYAKTPSTSIEFNPILNSLKGYAYDSQKKVIPNAKVYIYLDSSSKPYYQTSSDKTGYYQISQNSLPFFPYHIVYFRQNGMKVVTTAKRFLADNERYIKKNGVNLNKPVKATNVAEKSSSNSGNSNEFTVEKTRSKRNDQNDQLEEPTINNKFSQQSKGILMIVLILTILIGISIFLIIYFIKKNKKEEPPEFGI